MRSLLRTESLIYHRQRDFDHGRALWGPVTMEEGDLIILRDTIAPIVFHEFVSIELRDDDRNLRPDDSLGEFTISDRVTERLNQNVYLPGILASSNYQCYRINYDILEEPLSDRKYRITFISLTCNDAQGSKDRVSLLTNSRIIWGPREMRTGDLIRLDREGVHYTFHSSLSVRLRETYLKEWEDYFMLTEDMYPLPGIQRRDFNCDHITDTAGTARYHLTFQTSRMED